MTVKVPQRNILDKILAIFGKERDIIGPESTGKLYKKYGPYVYIKGERESFWKVLFKKKTKKQKKRY